MNINIAKFMISWLSVVERFYNFDTLKYFLMISIADVITTTWGFYNGFTDMSYFVNGLLEFSKLSLWGLFAFFIMFLIIKIIIILPFWAFLKVQTININRLLLKINIANILFILIALQTFVVIHNLIILSGW